LARGGARPNAGRKPGTLNRFNRELLERAVEGGQLPLDYMLEIMRDQYRFRGLQECFEQIKNTGTGTDR
jgi:hypothetical protein